jgi:hypothetical protein
MLQLGLTEAFPKLCSTKLPSLCGMATNICVPLKRVMSSKPSPFTLASQLGFPKVPESSALLAVDPTWACTAGMPGEHRSRVCSGLMRIETGVGV